MVRNLDHRVEATCPVLDENIKRVLKNILEIQLNDNVKARILNNELSNRYVRDKGHKRIRSQVEIYNYLHQQTIKLPEPVQPAPLEMPASELVKEYSNETGGN
jgi:polyphosphate kinase